MTEPRTPVTPELRAEIRSFCPPDGFVVALLDALEAAEGRITSLVVSGAEVTAARNDARAELRTARTDTLLLYWHADAHAEPDCKRCTEWFDVVLPAAMDAAGRARAALGQRYPEMVGNND